MERKGVGRVQRVLVLRLVASDGLRVGRAIPAPQPHQPFGALQTPPLHQLSPAAAGLDAETCIQTKKGGEGPEESWSPQCQGGLAPPAALRTEGFISGIQARPLFLPAPNHHIHTFPAVP